MTTTKATKKLETLDAVLEIALRNGADPRAAAYRWIDEAFEAGRITQLEARQYEAMIG
jgi:hypothetical protein